MTKDEFLKALLAEGFICEKSGQYPSVVCDAADVKKTAKKVRAVAKEKGYSSSFAIRSYRDGMELISKDGPVSKNMRNEVVEEQAEAETVSISEPIPMTAQTENVSAEV